MQSEPPLTSTGLDDLVIQFKACTQSSDVPQANRIFGEILARCEKTIRKMLGKYDNLGSFVEDVAPSILYECLLRFPGGSSFKGYFRKAICNAANSEFRRQKKMRVFLEKEKEKEKDNLIKMTHRKTEPDFENSIVDNEEVDLYVSRKRWLVDQLQLRPALKMATLLLDQRLRCAKLVYSSVLGQVSIWVERRECWHPNDHERHLDSANSPDIASVWSAFAEEQASSASPINQELIVRSIEASGGNVNLAMWRQRVCRYLQAVRDQVSEEEYRYFYPTI